MGVGKPVVMLPPVEVAKRDGNPKEGARRKRRAEERRKHSEEADA